MQLLSSIVFNTGLLICPHPGIKAENLLNKGKGESDMTKEGEDPVAKELLKDPLASHQKKLHICTECDNRFASKDNLKRHMRNIHGGGKKSEGKPAKGKREPDNDNNTDGVKETKPFNDGKYIPLMNFYHRSVILIPFSFSRIISPKLDEYKFIVEMRRWNFKGNTIRSMDVHVHLKYC